MERLRALTATGAVVPTQILTVLAGVADGFKNAEGGKYEDASDIGIAHSPRFMQVASEKRLRVGGKRACGNCNVGEQLLLAGYFPNTVAANLAKGEGKSRSVCVKKSLPNGNALQTAWQKLNAD